MAQRGDHDAVEGDAHGPAGEGLVDGGVGLGRVEALERLHEPLDHHRRDLVGLRGGEHRGHPGGQLAAHPAGGGAHGPALLDEALDPRQPHDVLLGVEAVASHGALRTGDAVAALPRPKRGFGHPGPASELPDAHQRRVSHVGSVSCQRTAGRTQHVHWQASRATGSCGDHRRMASEPGNHLGRPSTAYPEAPVSSRVRLAVLVVVGAVAIGAAVVDQRDDDARVEAQRVAAATTTTVAPTTAVPEVTTTTTAGDHDRPRCRPTRAGSTRPRRASPWGDHGPGHADLPGQPDPHLVRPGPGARRQPQVLWRFPGARRACAASPPPAASRRSGAAPAGPASPTSGSATAARGSLFGAYDHGLHFLDAGHRRAAAARLPDRRHQQGLGHRRPRRLPALSTPGSRDNLLPGDRPRPRRARGALVAGATTPCRPPSGTTTGTARRW